MKAYKEYYGADADGNRGEWMWMYELEDTPAEREEIAEILFDLGYTSEDTTKGVEIEYDGINIEVDVGDYSEELAVLERSEDATTY